MPPFMDFVTLCDNFWKIFDSYTDALLFSLVLYVRIMDPARWVMSLIRRKPGELAASAMKDQQKLKEWLGMIRGWQETAERLGNMLG